ncbi:IclR family transcriptional regulator [uncultured Oscillibacter sp.]|uniref:IclR family transcriptional regulator n=1 Tax=uncultured Oscillibacter sp. TaxID=876091 RepID=UPI0025DE88F7|nr:IclR family transcriptional regulator [uncultured Oscillibacter sp.]
MEAPSVQSLERAFSLLEALAEKPHGETLAALAGQTGLNKSTAHRLLANLMKLGYVTQDEESHRYYLTIKLFEIGSGVVHKTDILQFAKPYLIRASQVIGEVINLAVPNNNDVLFIYVEEGGKNAARVASHVGTRNPMYCTACGQAILATYSDEEIEKFWKTSSIVKYTNNTITDFQQLMTRIQLVRKTGYAIECEESENGIGCIAVSIIDYSGKAQGAISVSAPASRLNEAYIRVVAESLVGVGKKISMHFGKTEWK